MGTTRASLIEVIASVPVSSWASGPTAAALHGFDGFILRPPFHLTVERRHNLHRVGHHVHTTNLLDRIDRAWVDDIPVLSPARTLLHLGESESPERLTAAVDGAIRDGLVSEDFLHRRIDALRERGRGGVRPLLRAIEGGEIIRGGQSWLEREFLRLTAAAGLPRPAPQAVLGRRRDALIRVDCWFPGTNVVVELLGYRWHRTKPQMAIDVERVNRLQLLGYLVLQFTYPQIVGEGSWVVDVVAEALTRSVTASPAVAPDPPSLAVLARTRT